MRLLRFLPESASDYLQHDSRVRVEGSDGEDGLISPAANESPSESGCRRVTRERRKVLEWHSQSIVTFLRRKDIKCS